MTEDVEHRAMANPSPEEKDMGDPNKTHKTENAQYHAAASSTPEEVDWGDEDDETELHTAQNTATNSGGSDSDTENAPTAASEAFVHLNWPWGEHGRPSDRATSSTGGASRPRTPSRSPRREEVTLQPGPMWQAVQQVQRHMRRMRGNSRRP